MEQLGTSEADLRAKLTGLELFPVTYEVRTAEIEVEQEVSSEGGSSSSTQTETVSYLAATIHPLNQDAILEAFQLDPEATYGNFSITCGEAVSNMAAALKLTLYGSALGMVGGSVGSRRGNEEVAAIALSQVGQVGGYPYWSWYGFSSRVEWCACFVSWCYAQAGLSEPRFSGCTSGGMAWFQSHGQWAERDYEDIAPGDAIFFNWSGSSTGGADHVGIVVGVDESRVYTVEGNSGNRCLQLQKLPPGQLGDPRLRADAVAIKLSGDNHLKISHTIDIISVYRYNDDGGMVMTLNNLLTEKNMTKYQLSKKSGVPQTTVIDICSGKTRLEKCTAETVYRIAQALGVPMESLLQERMEKTAERRSSFEVFKSNVCHLVKDKGDIDFLIQTLESDEIRRLYKKRWYPESLYLLAMVDYLSRVNGMPLCEEYRDLRGAKLKQVLYPSSLVLEAKATKNAALLQQSERESIPEFMSHNIVEREVRNVI